MDRLTAPGPEGGRTRRDVASGAVLLGVAVAYGLGALRVPGAEGEPGPAFVPVVLAVLLAGLAAWIAGSALVAPSPAEEPADALPFPSGRARSEARVWLAVAATAAYAALFHVLGFALGTAGYTFAVTRLFTRNRRVLVTAPVLVTLVLYACFRLGLGVRLPPGPLG